MAAVGHLEFSKFKDYITWPLWPCYFASLCKILCRCLFYYRKSV